MTDQKLWEEVKNLKNTMLDLRNKVAGLKSGETLFDLGVRIKEWKEQLLGKDEEGSESSIAAILQEIDTLKVAMSRRDEHSLKGATTSNQSLANSEKSVSGKSLAPREHAPSTSSGSNKQPSLEQSMELKKQQLVMNALQDRIKELEHKLLNTQESLTETEGRLSELSNREEVRANEIYMTIDKIDNTVSKKIAMQREQLQILAGDVPAPINYDPFNYGEAYRGMTVDFEARNRVTQLALLYNILEARLKELKDSTSVSQPIDLGYKVVRLDQILNVLGESGRSDVSGNENMVVLDPPTTPSLLSFKSQRTEIFQNDDQQEVSRNWDVTNTLMQTIYRLELDIQDLKKKNDSINVAKTQKSLEEISAKLDRINKQKLEKTDVRDLIKTMISDTFTRNDKPDTREFVPKETFTYVVNKLGTALNTIIKHLEEIDTSFHDDTASKIQTKGTSVFPAPVPVLPRFPAQAHNKAVAKYKAMNRGFLTNANGLDKEFNLPRPDLRPDVTSLLQNNSALLGADIMDETELPTEQDRIFIQGSDGKIYFSGTMMNRIETGTE